MFQKSSLNFTEFCRLITARIRRMAKGNSFSLCVSPHHGGIPPSADWGGYPIRSQRGVPIFPDGGYSILPDRGTPSQVRMGGQDGGTPFQVRMGVPHPRSGQGVPHPRSGWGDTPSQVRKGGTPILA